MRCKEEEAGEGGLVVAAGVEGGGGWGKGWMSEGVIVPVPVAWGAISLVPFLTNALVY